MVPVSAALSFVLVAYVYVATGRRYQQVRGQYSESLPPGIEEQFDAYEIALLAGGKRRVGELALAHLYLDGHMRVTRRRRRFPRFDARVARVEVVAGESAPQDPRHPVPVDGLRAFEAGRKVHPGIVSRTAVSQPWVDEALARLREAGVLMRPEELRGIRGARRIAAAVHTVPATLLGTLVMFIVIFGLMITAIFAVDDAVRTRPPLGIMLLPVFAIMARELMRGYFLHGARLLVICVAAVASIVLLIEDIPTLVSVALLAYCGAWFVVYGVYVGTGGPLGPRTPPGDAVLAEAREYVNGSSHEDAGHVALMIALYGPAAAGLLPADDLENFYIEIGVYAGNSGSDIGDGGDGGPGGDFGFDGGSPGGSGGGLSGGGGDGGGSGGGDGGGGGGGP